MKVAVLALLVGLVASVGWIAMALGSAEVMPSYLAAWLFWMAVPLGALPLVMALEGLGVLSGTVLRTMRHTLLLLPIGALLALPVLLRTGVLYRRANIHDALPAAWMAPEFFITRFIVVLVVLSLLALVFSRSPQRWPRRGLAIVGLLLHLSLVSLAAVDWVMSLQPGVASSAFGLLLIASQLGTAASLAVMVITIGYRDEGVPLGLGRWLALLLSVWVFLHFTQYLVVWSANLPAEIVWYQARSAGGGLVAVWFAVIVSATGLFLLPSSLARAPAFLASFAGLLVLLHLIETLWLVTPAFRGQFTVTVPDLLAMFGLGGLLLGLLLMSLPRRSGVERHA